MKNTNGFFVVLSVLFLTGNYSTLNAQGPLAPPGPPAPMMKTLQEMEPRTHIKSLPYTITSSGSYYLTTNLNGGGGAGLVIQADHVTIDLRGFSILNCATGISAGAGVKGVAVHNGFVRSCTGDGIALGAVMKSRLEDVIVCENGGDGASVGPASIVTLCTAAGNSGRGLVLGDGGTVFKCVAQTNGNSGIVVSSNCQATENICTGTGSGAGQAGLLTAGDGNRVEGNSCNKNNGHGFKINGAENLVVRNNACGNTVSDYSVGAGNNYGQILLSPGAAFLSSQPWANFGCGGTPTTCQTSGDCDDGNPCTTGTCINNTCVYTNIPNCWTNATCGNGIVEPGETCDDGNTLNGDGCSATCETENCTSAAQCDDGVDCTVDACVNNACTHTLVTCDDGNPCTTDTCMGVIRGVPYCRYVSIPNCTSNSVCGNGIIEAGEACDDGGANNLLGPCLPTCQPAACGDGIFQPGLGEQCDDGNLVNGDGCSATCQIEGCTTAADCPGTANVCGAPTCIGGACGFTNFPAGTVCAPASCSGLTLFSADLCDGAGTCVDSGAQNCNDGDACTTDGCDSMAVVCTHVAIPNCGAVCGNGVLDPGEGCDDGGTSNGDGCNSTCKVENGNACNANAPGATGNASCASGVCDTTGGTPGVCEPADTCGNGVVEAGEGCDDGGNTNGDGCSSTCQVEGPACTNGQTQSCYTGPGGTAGVGACQAGTQTCTGGNWGPCVGQVTPTTEVCDGIDNNCDGQIDEGNPGGGQACNTGMVGVCAAGTTVCQNGTVVCVQNVQPSTEICDGQDNNCNGQVDEGNPGGGGACSTGQLGICAPGTTACAGGAVVCNRNQNPTTEVCNGLDDDCDGAVDEGLAIACYTGPGGTQGVGVCHAGTQTCAGGAYGACVGQVLPTTEICNNSDDNCDGVVDNGAACAAGQSCVSGACKKNQGVACVISGECASGFCVDGVCCNSACNGVCVACTAVKKGSGADGTCGNIATGIDPDNECALACNGAGACQ